MRLIDKDALKVKAEHTTIRFEPMRLDRKDIDLTHYIDPFELIGDLVKRSMADKR